MIIIEHSWKGRSNLQRINIYERQLWFAAQIEKWYPYQLTLDLLICILFHCFSFHVEILNGFEIYYHCKVFAKKMQQFVKKYLMPCSHTLTSLGCTLITSSFRTVCPSKISPGTSLNWIRISPFFSFKAKINNRTKGCYCHATRNTETNSVKKILFECTDRNCGWSEQTKDNCWKRELISHSQWSYSWVATYNFMWSVYLYALSSQQNSKYAFSSIISSSIYSLSCKSSWSNNDFAGLAQGVLIHQRPFFLRAGDVVNAAQRIRQSM